MNLEKLSKIYIAGHRGLVGSALVRHLKAKGYNNQVMRTHAELELTDPGQVDTFFREQRPQFVFLAAAKVGGIQANNTYPADFIRINLQVQTNILHAAYQHGVEKLVFLGSSCIYPRNAHQPMKEEYLLTGKLESTNDAYAIAKIAGIVMCKSYNRQLNTNFVAAMPTNLYGPGDNFDLESSHVLPALIRKFHEAKTNQNKHRHALGYWGTHYESFFMLMTWPKPCCLSSNDLTPIPKDPMTFLSTSALAERSESLIWPN